MLATFNYLSPDQILAPELKCKVAYGQFGHTRAILSSHLGTMQTPCFVSPWRCISSYRFAKYQWLQTSTHFGTLMVL